MEDVKEKHCPFRTYRIKDPGFLGYASEGFHRCMGEKCAAYYKGGCLRLGFPALMIGDSPLRMRADLTDAEIEKLREEMSKSANHSYNLEQESVEVIPHLYEGETIFADWHERLNLLEYVYNPGNDGPWYRADDVWACIDPARQEEVDK